MKIAVIGGGNVGTLIAAEAAYKGYEVIVYTSQPEHWQKEISVYDTEGKILLTACISKVTDSMGHAVKDADYIFVVMPAHQFKALAGKMLPYVHGGQRIGIIPGSGGAEFVFHDMVRKGCILFGMQRVHSIARLKKYGEAVFQLGRRQSLQIGAIPISGTAGVCRDMEMIFDMPCEALDNYLSVTLTPSNQILHTTRLHTMFWNYKPGDIYPRNFLFYEGWTDHASWELLACDQELQALCEAIPMELGSVVSLRDYYESWTVEAMTRKIRGIQAFKGLASPMKKAGDGWLPDWYSRYFTADFSFGLKVIKDIANIFAVPTPNIDIIWKWYIEVAKRDDMDVFHIGGICTRDDFIGVYGCR